ncbi:MAG: 2-amino-4-hydroxy-6-hydroxymethyldihydropteridine diphosphokinase [Xanthobacteraceae bacterium]|nr:MAG: 2-amino-4-hydroxy-6-hydroxymethyldihydropteridine diphosphokinase [Xanthobacteraceae bacterium]
MAIAYIALGGNVGDVRETFRQAIAALCAQARAGLLARSSDYRTPPWGDTAQADFINACIAVTTELAPHALLAALQTVERRFGRDRAREHRYGPRTLDLDLIAYDDMRLDTPDLTLPHPGALARAFVLVPLAEIAPGLMLGDTRVDAALARLPTTGISRLPDPGAD